MAVPVFVVVLASRGGDQADFGNSTLNRVGLENENWFLWEYLVANSLDYVFRAGEQCPVMIKLNFERMLFVSPASPCVMQIC